jgi:hypothetical protein
LTSKHAVRCALAFASLAIAVGAAGPATSLADDPAATGGIASAASTGVILRKGDRGPAVAAVQRRLRLSADGVFGPLTYRAVRRFQRRNRLAVDGIVGPITRRALRLRPFSAASVRHPRTRARRRVVGRAQGLRNLPRVLVRIARCESGGNPRAVSRNGLYRGKYQFSRSTWKAWGGRTRDPARASEAHQDAVALRLYRARGTAPWPSCG